MLNPILLIMGLLFFPVVKKMHRIKSVTSVTKIILPWAVVAIQDRSSVQSFLGFCDLLHFWRWVRWVNQGTELPWESWRAFPSRLRDQQRASSLMPEPKPGGSGLHHCSHIPSSCSRVLADNGKPGSSWVSISLRKLGSWNTSTHNSLVIFYWTELNRRLEEEREGSCFFRGRSGNFEQIFALSMVNFWLFLVNVQKRCCATASPSMAGQPCR